MILVVLLLVITLIVWAASALFSRNAPTADPSAAQAASSSVLVPTPTASSAASAASTAAEPTSSASETESADREPAASCELADLEIEASSNRATYTGGEEPIFYMTVNNPTDSDCVIDLDENILRFEVYDLASNERVWADTDCSAPVEVGSQEFPAQAQRHFQAVWSRLDSAPDQCANRQPAAEGGYFLHAVIGDNPSASYTFNLRS